MHNFDIFTWQDSPDNDGFSIVTHNTTDRKMKVRGAIAPWNITESIFDRMYKELHGDIFTQKITIMNNYIVLEKVTP